MPILDTTTRGAARPLIDVDVQRKHEKSWKISKPNGETQMVTSRGAAKFLVSGCFDVMKAQLRFNICKIEPLGY